jgi:hypothetical protein
MSQSRPAPIGVDVQVSSFEALLLEGSGGFNPPADGGASFAGSFVAEFFKGYPGNFNVSDVLALMFS